MKSTCVAEGLRNPNIISFLQENLPNTKILPLDKTGVPFDAKEAVPSHSRHWKRFWVGRRWCPLTATP